MSGNTTGTPSVLKQVMLAINLGYDDNDIIQVEIICPKLFDKDHPEAIKITEKYADAWYNDLLEYSRRVLSKEVQA